VTGERPPQQGEGVLSENSRVFNLARTPDEQHLIEKVLHLIHG
jgi:hypothetical protein